MILKFSHILTSEDPDNPPPSYESLYGKMQDCGQETINTFDVLRQSTSYLVGDSKSILRFLIQ